MFQVVYDLAFSPPTYDIISYLCEVERERLVRGEGAVGITFLPGPANGFRADAFWPFSVEERVKMRDRVARPICWLLPCVKEVKLAQSRLTVPVQSFGFGVGLYGMARQVAASRDGIRPLRAIEPLEPKHTRLVTMTLRESEHWPERNSQVEEWVAAAEALEDDGWDVIIVRDSLRAREKLGDRWTDATAAESMISRARLYTSAAVNMFVSNGPGWLALAMDLPVLMLRPTNDHLGGPFGEGAFHANGVEPGGQIPGAPPYQRLVWASDTRDEILRAFHEYVAATSG